jgi:uncharacterized membrane protein
LARKIGFPYLAKCFWALSFALAARKGGDDRQKGTPIMKLRNWLRGWTSLESAPVGKRRRSEVRRHGRPTRHLHLEQLEERILLDGGLPAAIIVGRTLSSYFAGGIQNNQETITYTVYNEQANPVSGVLLTDTLAPGVTIQTASQLPDQSGQNLAWSLGTVQGYDRTSVTLTVALDPSLLTPPPTAAFQLDTGAQAFAMLDAGAVSNTTPAVTVKPGNVSDPGILASTPDANTTDPYIQEEAAKLNYDPQQIFDFLHTDIGYNSYLGSLRGARGTLWSSAGNALDVASLGVALMRASGIPAQYAEGTLSQSQAQQLILSMFPVSYQTVGYIPAGTQTADPADDPQLLSETESHYWFQFDAGNGMQDADPLMAGAQLGQTYSAATGAFAEVAQSLRQTTELSLTAEMYSQADAGIGLNPLQTTLVLDQTFNDVDLVGRPLTIGNFVLSSSAGTSVFSSITNTYTPYLIVGDDALADSQLPDATIGQQYQEVLTSFPLSSHILTGLFLNVTLAGGGTPSETYPDTLVDRIGYAARQDLVPPQSISVGQSDLPIITPFDLTTLYILPGLQNTGAAQLEQSRANQESVIISAEAAPSQVVQAQLLTEIARAELSSFAVATDQETANLANESLIAAYFSIPRITVFSSQLVASSRRATISYGFNLLHDSIRSVASPDANPEAPVAFALTRGIFDSFLEASSLPLLAGGQNLSSASIMQQSVRQGIPFSVINASSLPLMQSLPLPADAKARISANVRKGLTVLVPTQPLTMNGIQTSAWWVVNPKTGEMLSESQNGGYAGDIEYGKIIKQALIAIAIIGVEHLIPLPFPVVFVHVGDVSVTALLALGKLFPAFTVTFGVISAILLVMDLAALSKSKFSSHMPDPPLPPTTFDVNPPTPNAPTEVLAPVEEQRNTAAGPIVATVQASVVAASGNLAASWSSAAKNSLVVTSLVAAVATVVDSQGFAVGSGRIGFGTVAMTPVSISGSRKYTLSGRGSLAFYESTESGLGVSGDWNSYSAVVTGDFAISLTVSEGLLELNGEALPAGTYTITTESATLSGSGHTVSPNFTRSASITAANSTLLLGPISSITVEGTSLGLSSGATLDDYTGSVTIAAGGGNNVDDVTLDGNAARVLTVSATPNTLTTDHGRPVAFEANINTSFADTYTLTAEAPAGWTVTIENVGNIAVMAAPGVQGGTYPILVVAESNTNPNLVAQTTVYVSINPTQPGLDFTVIPDAIFTVPFNGAQLPTAFRATLHNLGPAADSYNLTFSNIPAGFSLLNSGTSVTVPAEQTGILGLYLQPNAGQALPPPGTQLSFTVTATSTTNPAITLTITETFTMPNLEAVSVGDDPVQVNTVPGQGGTTTLTLQNVGNVPANEALLTTASPGLTVSEANSPVSFALGASTTQTLTLTPDASTPLNTTLQATLTYGPAATQNVVSLVNVNPSTSFTDAGQSVTVSGDILNGVLQTEAAQASFTVLDGSGNVVYTSAAVPLTLSALTNVQNISLGSLDTTGYAAGQYAINVTIADNKGKPIPGATGTASLVIGAPVTASLSVSSDAISPVDSNTVFSTLTVGNPGNDSQSLTASVTVPTTGTAAVVPDSFSVQPDQVVPGNGTETLVWNLTLDAGASSQITWETTLNGLASGQVATVADLVTIQVGSQQFTLPASNVAGVPETQTLIIPVQVVVPGAKALANAAVVANQLGRTDLANRLTDLSTALANLVQDPTNPIYQSQALANLDTLISLINEDPILAYDDSFGLASDRKALAAATTATQVQDAITQLGGHLGELAQNLSNEAAHGFTLSLSPSSAVALPGAPATFDLVMQNTGTLPTTYDFSVNGLPASVQAAFNQTSITLQPGEAIPDGANRVTLSLKETGNELFPHTFTVVATAEGTHTSYPDVVLNAQGSLTVRNTFVSVTNVTATPPFAQPGAQVDVGASVIDLVNQAQTDQVSYTVVDPSGAVVYTSTPVSLTFDLTTSFATVDLGSFDTTGLALGTYPINVSVTDSSGQPIPGGTGQANLFLGSPVTASLTVSPATVIAGQGGQVATNTLQIASQTPFPAPLTQVGQVPTTPTSLTMALDGNLAYIAGTNGIDIVDISDPTNPQLVNTFAQKQIVAGGFTVVRQATIGGSDYLVVGTTADVNPTGTQLLIYSLASDPKNPALVSTTTIPYVILSDLLVQGNTVLMTTTGIASLVQTYITDQFGTVLAIDISNPAAPQLANVLFNARGPTFGGYNNQDGGTIVNNQIAYIASTTSQGSEVQKGTGQVQVVDYSNPDQLALDEQLDIPGTLRIEDIAIQGNQALVVGSTGGWYIHGFGDQGFSGQLTLTMLDITDPQNPQILSTTLVTDATFPSSLGGLGTKLSAVALGNGLFAVSDALINGNPVLLIVDPSNPNNIVVAAMPEPAVVNQLAVAGGLLYAPSAAGLAIYSIGNIPSIPLTISVQIPNNTSGSIVPGSFPIPPTQIITGTDYDTLVWDRSLAAGDVSTTLTWQSQLTTLNPGENSNVTLGGAVDFVSQGTAGVVNLPPTDVIAKQVVSLSPSAQTVQPGATATYDITVNNPVDYNTGYSFAVQGLPASWVNVSSSPLLSPGSSAEVPLLLTPPPNALPGTYQFVLVASGAGAQEAAHASLTVAGTPIPLDPEAHGIIATLTPAQASAGQGTAAQYTVQLTNTGSADDTFSLATSGLPAGVTAAFSQASVDVPPGISNFRDVTLTLTSGAGTPPNAYPFQVLATSTSDSSVTNSASGTLNVVAQGVSVTLNPPSDAPGSSFQMTITNTGSVQDTFDLSLGGPAALVASLGTNQVTLAPGASQVVPITTSAVNFAVQGSLGLTAMAQSEGNSAVQASASAALTIPATTGLTVQLSPGSQTLQAPGNSSFMLLVNNTGNTEDAYTATITGASGPTTGTLMGLDGQPTQTIPEFRLPGLSTGAILLQTNTPNAGQGAVTVQVNSLNNPTNTATETATVDLSPAVTTTTVSSDHASGSVYGQTVTFTATVSAATGTPTGSVQFQIDGSASGSPVTMTSGAASITANLPAGQHNVTAFYTSDNGNFTASDNSASPLQRTISPASLTITADNQSMVYGGTLPALTASYSGLVNGDTPATFSVSPNVPPVLGTVPATSHAGSDAITVSGAADPNYSISYVPGTLTITPAPLVITADNKSKVSGSPLPALTASYSGFVNGDTAASLTTPPSLTTTATPASPALAAGYSITASAAFDPDYSISYVSGTLTVTPASLATLTGTIFFDFNANGKRDANDLGLAGRKVFLDLQGDAKLDAGDPTAVTGPGGTYQFTGLTDGTYTVREVLPYANVALTSAVAGQSATSSTASSETNFGVVLYNPAYPVYPQPDLWRPHPNPDTNTAFVRGLYRTVLNRDAEPAGLASWLSKLASGVTQTQVAWDIVNSTEHLQDEVDAYYETLLGRAPDPASVSWVDLLQRNGNEAEVIEGIVTSAEFTAAHASSAAFIADLYRRLLGREADPAGDAYWQQRLAQGTSRSGVAAGILDSLESAELAVVADYAAFLHRPGEGPGQADWVARLSSESLTFSQVAQGFLASHEFELDTSQNVATSYPPAL